MKNLSFTLLLGLGSMTFAQDFAVQNSVPESSSGSQDVFFLEHNNHETNGELADVALAMKLVEDTYVPIWVTFKTAKNSDTYNGFVKNTRGQFVAKGIVVVLDPAGRSAKIFLEKGSAKALLVRD